MARTLSGRIAGLGLLVAFAATSISVLPAAPSFASDLWTQIGVDIDGEAGEDFSGWSVSSSSDGSTVAIGAPGNDGAGIDEGQVRVYSFDGAAWVQVGADIDGEAGEDFSGSSVSLSSNGNTVAIGARFNDGTSINAGHVRVYAFGGGGWVQVGTDIDGEATDDQSGSSVSLSSDGNTVAIGAPLNDGTYSNAGHVRVYTFAGGVWGQVGADIDGEAADDQSGSSVSLSDGGSTVAIGARFNDGTGINAGHVRVYAFGGGGWVQVDTDIDGEATGDLSGSSVSLSSDGNTVAIGARFNGGAGINGGHVRVYTFGGGGWVQVDTDIDGEAAGDQSGSSVSLSSDGNTVAIGAPPNDGAFINAGQVRVYSFLAPAAEPELAATGALSATSGLVAAGFALTLAGGVLVWLTRRELRPSRP